MVSKKSREQLVIEFAQSYRLTGQLFFKLLQATVQENPACNLASLPILKMLRQQGVMPQHAIASSLHHSGAAVSRQIGILTKDGLVITRPDEHSRRTTLVELTGEGDKVLGELEAAITSTLTNVLETIPDDKLEQYIKTNSEIQAIITPKLQKETHV